MRVLGVALRAGFLLAASWALSGEVAACSCAVYGTPPCAAYWNADAVFTGVVADIKKLPEPAPGSLPVALVRFIVEDKLRGITAEGADVETLSGTSCDITFKKGERWMVYGYRNAATGRLAVHPCTRTRRLELADEDLAYARGVAREAPRQSVSGRLGRHTPDTAPPVKVTVVGGGQSFETTTGDEGHFSVQLPKGGAYTVRAVFPYSARVFSRRTPVREVEVSDWRTVFEYPVEVPSGGCAYDEVGVYEVDLHATAEVSGKVSDEEGRPVTRGFLHLWKMGPEDEEAGSWSQIVRIAEDGSFKFHGIPAGSFLLAFNPRDKAPDDSDAPHPRTFYPHAADRAQASPLVITEGLKLEGIDFRVRPALKKRVIEGRVLWPDGRPEAGASVVLYNGEHYVRRVETDAAGRFSMEAYGDFDYFDYQLLATGEKSAQSRRVKVPRTGRPAPLVLKPKPE